MFKPEDHTFVVCAYKENPFLENTMQSLLNQSVLGKVVVSTSTPNNHINTVASKFGAPVIVNPNPHLAGDDWNYGYNSARTDLVTIAHQDDFYEPGYLEEVLRVANNYDPSELSMIFTDYYELRGGKRVEDNALLNIKKAMNKPLQSKFLNGSKWVKKRLLGFGDAICCPAVTYAKCNIGESIFDTKYINSCDYKAFVDLAFKEGRFVYIPKAFLGHRIYEESATTRNLADNIRKKEDGEIFELLWPKPIAKLINSFYALSEKSNEL